jgi:hypothetical protein
MSYPVVELFHMRKLSIIITLIVVWFALVSLACNLSGDSRPPTIVPRATNTPQPTIAYATLAPEQLPQQQQPGAAATNAASPRLNIEAMLSQVSGPNLMQHISVMQSFQTRHINSTFSSPSSGIGAAYRYVREQFDSISAQYPDRFFVSDPPFTVTYNAVESVHRNVLGLIRGTATGGGVIVIGAHYDSISRDMNNAEAYAPGANDNASGVAGLLEIARILSARDCCRATIIFVAFGAEEIGRLGSREFVNFLRQNNSMPNYMLNMDIIGSRTGPNGQVDDRLRIFSAGPVDSVSRQLARAVYWVDYNLVPTMEVTIQDEVDRAGRYSDHMSFSEAGVPAIRFIEAAEEVNRQHTAQDTIDDIQEDYLIRSTQSILTSLYALANGLPPPPTINIRDEANSQRTLYWDAVPGASSYLIGLRYPGSNVINNQFPWTTNSVTWDGFLPEYLDAVVISVVDSNGLMGAPSREFPIR